MFPVFINLFWGAVSKKLASPRAVLSKKGNKCHYSKFTHSPWSLLNSLVLRLMSQLKSCVKNWTTHAKSPKWDPLKLPVIGTERIIANGNVIVAVSARRPPRPIVAELGGGVLVTEAALEHHIFALSCVQGIVVAECEAHNKSCN